jgi:vacuolar protein sorting-associated protein 1
MIDMVPKAIMLNLVQYVHPRLTFTKQVTNAKYRFTKDDMQKELLENMYRATELDDLLKESDYTVRRRKECQQMVESLSRASEIVSQVQ